MKGGYLPDIYGRERSVLLQIVGLAAVLLLLALTSTFNYLLFHSIVEIFTIVVSFSIFILIWNGRKYIENAFFLVVGVGFLFSGGIDLIHTLAYKGMGVFTFGGADLPTQLWIAARYLQAFSLLIAPLAIGRKVRLSTLLAVFGVAFAVLVGSIFAGDFPHCFIEGQGLTPFKIYSEYIISAMLVASMALLYRARAHFDPDVLTFLLLANAFTIAAELSFSTYISVYGFANMLGHLFRLVAVYLWYLAFLSVGQKRPFDLLWRELKGKEERIRQSEEKYRTLFTHMLEGFAYCRMIYDEQGRPADWEYLEVNPAFERLTGLKEITGKRVSEAIPGVHEANPELFEIYGRVASTGQPDIVDVHFRPLGIWLHISVFSPKKDHFVAVFEDITKNKIAEERQSFLSSIIEYSNDGIIGKTLDGVITSWNLGAENIYGYTAEEVIGQTVFILVPPGHVDDTRMMLEKIRAGKPVIHHETVRKRKDGRIIDVSLTTSPIKDSGGTLIGASTIIRDITEQKKTEKYLRYSNTLLTTQQEASLAGILVVDESGKILSWNQRFADIWRTPPDVLGSRSDERALQFVMDQLADPDEFLRRVRYLYEHRAEKSREEVELRDGRVIDRYSAPLIGSDGTYYGRIWFFLDITDQKQAENILKAQSEEREWLLKSMTNAFVIFESVFDDAGRFISYRFEYINNAYEQITGVRLADVKGKTVHEVWPDTEPEWIENYGAVAVTGITRTFDLYHEPTRKDYHCTVYRPWDTQDRFCVIFEDITDRKRVEEALRRSEEEFRDLYDNAPNAYFSIGNEGTITKCNTQAEIILGISHKEIIGRKIFDFYADTPDGKEKARDIFARFQAGQTIVNEELQMVRADGQVIWINLSVNPVLDVLRKVKESRSIVIDITDRKMMESEIRSLNTVLEQKVAERTEELASTNVALEEEIFQRGEAENQLRASLNDKILLLREVHHRVKNNLQIIISLTNLQLRQLEDPQMKRIMAETQNRIRAMSLVHEKLYKSESLSHIDLAEYVRFLTTQLFTYYEIDTRKVTLRIEIGKIMVPINTAIPLGLIINELVSNAFKHAFPDDRTGSLFLSARQEGTTIHLEIRDNGIGIPDGFDWRNALSLGLRLVISLVNQLEGTIELDRSTGTAFSMVLQVKE